MPDLSDLLAKATSWLIDYGIPLVFWTAVLIVGYRLVLPTVHGLVHGLLRAQDAALSQGGAPAEELRKRTATLEALVRTLLRAGVVLGFLLLVIGVFGLAQALTGLGLATAALTLAGKDIVLDYLMGILILVEGQYYAGDWIDVVQVEGEVEEVGLRRTILRDTAGTVHSVSNGLIRTSSNLTRIFAVASVSLQVLRTSDIERAIAVADRVGEEMAADPAWEGRLLETPHNTSVTALSVEGATIKIGGRVRPADRWTAAGDLRRRLAAAFASEGIETARWDRPPSDVVAAAGGPALPSDAG